MPTSEAQKRAIKNWNEKNREKLNEIKRNAYHRRSDTEPDYNEIMKKKSRDFYWKNRNKILEKRRLKYLQEMEISEDSPQTDSESTISDITDYTSVAPSTIETPTPEPEPYKPVHPFFARKI